MTLVLTFMSRNSHGWRHATLHPRGGDRGVHPTPWRRDQVRTDSRAPLLLRRCRKFHPHPNDGWLRRRFEVSGAGLDAGLAALAQELDVRFQRKDVKGPAAHGHECGLGSGREREIDTHRRLSGQSASEDFRATSVRRPHPSTQDDHDRRRYFEHHRRGDQDHVVDPREESRSAEGSSQPISAESHGASRHGGCGKPNWPLDSLLAS
jgi:hypothetical protein